MRRSFPKPSVLWLPVLIGICIPGCQDSDKEISKGSEKKIQVLSADDLPNHTYKIEHPPTKMICDQEMMGELIQKVRADLEQDLNLYEFKDRSALKEYYARLMSLDILEKKDDSALENIKKYRACEDKEILQLIFGLEESAFIEARRKACPNDEKFKQVFFEIFSEKLQPLPWNVVKESVLQAKGQTEILTRNLILGAVEARLGPVIEKTGELTLRQAMRLIGNYYALECSLPVMDELRKAYLTYVDKNRSQKKPDIWEERDFSLSKDNPCHEVLVAVFDTGIDTALFLDRLFINPGETLDNRDTDGNGFTDDVHGIAFDVQGNRTQGTLLPLGEAEERTPAIMGHIKGFLDIQSSVDSPDASECKQYLKKLKPTEIKSLIEDFSLAGNYIHGTHVAGIVADKNPWVRLMVARLNKDHRLAPIVMNKEWAHRMSSLFLDSVEYFKKNKVRLVNMSLNFSIGEIISSLERNGLGKDANDRYLMAKAAFGIVRKGMYEALKGAPEMLFVCSAGNADNNMGFLKAIPSTLKMKNMIVVGAVDQAGDRTAFTNFGSSVKIFANGYEKESVIPGGKRIKFSGTSIATPGVTNLAAKLLAMDPSLQPADLIRLILEGADEKAAGSEMILLMNPKAARDLLSKRLKE